MKTVVIVTAVLMLTTPLTAVTNIFGTEPNNKNVIVTAGAQAAEVALKWEPVERFLWGPRIQGSLTDNADQSASRWDSTTVGISCEYPLLKAESLFENLPLEATVFAGIGADLVVNDGDSLLPKAKVGDVLVPIEAGFDVKFNDHVWLRTTGVIKELNGNKDASKPGLRIGVRVRW